MIEVKGKASRKRRKRKSPIKGLSGLLWGFAHSTFAMFEIMMETNNFKPYFSGKISVSKTREVNLMKGRFITAQKLEQFKQHLLEEERSAATVEKYLRDTAAFVVFLAEREATKEIVIAYKQKLIEDGYAVRSINSMLASINSLFSFLDWYDCKVKTIKLQRQIFCSEDQELTKAEYIRLINAAQQKKNDRLNLIIQTICGTGIRVSELQFITVEAVKRGEATVNCKGKIRTIFIVKA